MQNERPPDRPDFYVRLSEQQVLGLKLRLLHAQLDEHADPLQWEGPASEWRGFTEWTTDDQRVVSVGWDWVTASDGDIRLAADSLRTNLMVVDAQGRDLGAEATSACILQLLGTMQWQRQVLAFLSGDR